MSSTIEAIEVGNAEGDQVEVTIRGSVDHVVKALVGGLPRQALVQLSDAMASELAKRSDEAQESSTSKG